jgi:uncharacterized membrane protein YgcG
MYFTRVKGSKAMKAATRTGLLMAALAGVGVIAAGCADEKQLANDMGSADFGRAVHEDLAAQIADPDAVYKGPPPPSSGQRADLAQTRYQADKVTPPASVSTGGGGGGGGSSGGGGGGGSSGGGGGGGGSTGP